MSVHAAKSDFSAIQLALEQTINEHDDDNQNYDRIYFFVVLRKPVREVNIKISQFRFSVFPGDDGDRTDSIESYQNKTFQENETEADPNPLVYPINHHCVGKIEYYTIKERPNERVDCFNCN